MRKKNRKDLRCFDVSLPNNVFSEQRIRLFDGPAATVNYPTKVLAKALTLEMHNDSSWIKSSVKSLRDENKRRSAKDWAKHLTQHTRPAVASLLQWWWETKHKDGIDPATGKRPPNWIQAALNTIDTIWLEKRLIAELRGLEDNCAEHYSHVLLDVLPNEKKRSHSKEIVIIESFSPPEERFAIGVPTSVFAEAHMTQFADEDVNYPTRVLAKALCLEMLQGNLAIATCKSNDPSADEWIRRYLTLRTSFAVLAALEAWWKKRCSLVDGTWSPVGDPKHWLDSVIREIDTDWVNASVRDEVGSACSDCTCGLFENLYEAKLAGSLTHEHYQKGKDSENPFANDSAISVTIDLRKIDWEPDPGEIYSDGVRYCHSLVVIYDSFRCMPIPMGLSSGGFPLARFGSESGVSASVFAEENMTLFDDKQIEVSYPTKVLTKALTLEAFKSNPTISEDIFFTSIGDDFVPHKILVHYLSLHTSLAVLSSLKNWWDSTYEGNAELAAKWPKSSWLAGALSMIDTSWIKSRFSDISKQWADATAYSKYYWNIADETAMQKAAIAQSNDKNAGISKGKDAKSSKTQLS